MHAMPPNNNNNNYNNNNNSNIITHADGSRGVGFSPAFVCLSLRLSVFPQDISKTAAASITKHQRDVPSRAW